MAYKTEQDILAALRNELNQWFIKQSKEPWDDYYLYYLPSAPNHDGGVLICKDTPVNSEYQLSVRIRKDMTIDQNMMWLQNHIVGSLPVLSY